ncbi:hypothetical protein [Sphingobium fluviale]|uniref:Uncharacterized protein n=1 Tax=Sphingobium fluviale TaxID=2506423 RepID=A0A4Q1KGY3_9SPHN|nr:hypothetical protein [Sphingobium fluviale]RXR28978.1 hypothetical protein EQG66_07825 [Sphingobium fluviale]
MGLNIMLMTPEGSYHPDWDDGKFAGDREACGLICGLPNIQEWINEIDARYRPYDFAAWRAAPWPDDNPDRWSHLIDLLEADERYWINFSY